MCGYYFFVELTATLIVPMQDGTTPLYMASFKNSIEIIQFLLASGAKVNLGRKVRNQCSQLANWISVNLQEFAYKSIITSSHYNIHLAI